MGADARARLNSAILQELGEGITARPTAGVTAVVCIPTFRRPESLRRTLKSLLRMNARCCWGCVVVDNDSEGLEGVEVAVRLGDDIALPLAIAIEPEQGNCSAINSCFVLALSHFRNAEYLLMIDDDEWASEKWLDRMISAAECSGAGIVGGPVFPIIESEKKKYLQGHPAFRPAYSQTGEVRTIYGSGNCLIRREVFERLGLPYFDPKFSFLGGGDTDFFLRCRAAGIRFFWEQRAAVYEDVPVARTATSWILRRSLRIGAINYFVDRRKHGETAFSRIRVTTKSLVLLAIGAISFVPTLVRERSALAACHKAAVAVGRLLAEIGIYPKQYRAAKTTSK